MARSRVENKIFRGMGRHIRFRNIVTACIKEHTNRYREKFIEEYKNGYKKRRSLPEGEQSPAGVGEVVEGGQLDRAGAGGEGTGAGPGLSTGSGETRGHVMRAGRGAQPAPSSWNAGSLPENDGRQVRGQDWRPWQLRGLWG